MKVNEKVVFQVNIVKIVREQSYGFRCNSLSTNWYVYKGDNPVGSYSKLKYAKASAERHIRDLADE
jgi:hypothetical protein